MSFIPFFLPKRDILKQDIKIEIKDGCKKSPKYIPIRNGFANIQVHVSVYDFLHNDIIHVREKQPGVSHLP